MYPSMYVPSRQINKNALLQTAFSAILPSFSKDCMEIFSQIKLL